MGMGQGMSMGSGQGMSMGHDYGCATPPLCLQRSHMPSQSTLRIISWSGPSGLLYAYRCHHQSGV